MPSDTSSLNPAAKAIADAFLAAFPEAVITSALRSIDAQAIAMASNVVKNRKWIAETYAPSLVANECQAWVDAHPQLTNAVALAGGLRNLLHTFQPEQLRHLTWHLAGDAFDVEPDGDSAKVDLIGKLLADRIAAGGQGKFLTKEGGLGRWHVQVI